MKTKLNTRTQCVLASQVHYKRRVVPYIRIDRVRRSSHEYMMPISPRSHKEDFTCIYNTAVFFYYHAFDAQTPRTLLNVLVREKETYPNARARFLLLWYIYIDEIFNVFELGFRPS